MGSDSGLSIAAGGGVMFLSEISDVKIETTFEKDGESVGQKRSVELEDAAFELGWSVDGALGYQFGGIRAEAEFSYLSVNQNKIGDEELKAEDYDALPQLTAMSFMANGWYELDTGTPFSPFIGIGLGVANVSSSTRETHKDALDDFEPTGVQRLGVCVSGGCRPRGRGRRWVLDPTRLPALRNARDDVNVMRQSPLITQSMIRRSARSPSR